MADSLAMIYAAIPGIDCAGKCVKACGPVPLFPAEELRLAEHGAANGFMPFDPKTLQCSHLNSQGRCGIYQKRPLICRMYGNVPRLECPYGCKPKRLMTEYEAQDLIRRAQEVE